jgi:hypothetical protein
MKMLAAILVAVALVSPAFAQKPAFQGTHPRPKLPPWLPPPNLFSCIPASPSPRIRSGS